VVQRGDDILGTQTESDFDPEAFPREKIDNRQRPDPSPIDQLIRHKVHAPDIVRSTRGTLRVAVDGRDVTPWTLAPQPQVSSR